MPEMITQSVDDIFADMVTHYDAPQQHPETIPEGFGAPVQLTPEEIDAAVAQFAGELNGDDLTDNRFTAEDNAFLEANGITSRHMTEEELAQVAAREERAHRAAQVVRMSDFIIRHDILSDFNASDKKKKKTAFTLAA